ncbi:MAG: tetratricopeptide repeat protein [Thermoanaerobaculia bacterium]
MMTLELDRIFQGGRIPGWLQKFEDNPSEALEDLLLGRAALGHLNADEPVEILLDWLESLGERSEFPAQVDAALAEWIERSWGRSRLPKTESAAVLAVAWTRAANLIAFEPRLVQAARQLRSYFPKDRSFLSALSEGRARDPEGRAWLAVARHQEDRLLLSDWWRLCNLAPDVPWYHGIYGIQGLRGLPAESASREGAFPTEVAEGLARLASGLARRSGEGWLEPAAAREEFLRTARLTMSAYPAARWVSFWRHVLQENRLRDYEGEARSWIQDLFPQELKNLEDSERRGGQKRWMQPDINWSRTAQRIAARLRERDFGVLGEAEQLLREQKRFAETTGDAYFLVRSACYFAARVRDSRPDLALEWAELARRFDPWHAYAWTTAAASLLTLGRLSEAHEVAIGAVQRFPQDPVARSTFGEILKAEGRFLEAEAVYRETASRFPKDEFARNGLAEVLRARGRNLEAETVYRETVSLFPEDVVARNGLAEVLRAQGRYPEAEAVYRETLEIFPYAEDARRGLRGLLRGLQEQREEKLAFVESTEIKPVMRGRGEQDQRLENLLASPDIDILLQDVYLLRRWATQTDRSFLRSSPGDLRKIARQKLRTLLDSGWADSELVGELGLLSLETKDLEEILNLLREAAKRYPGSARVRYTLARAERELAALRRQLDPQNPEAPVQPWRRLGRVDERLVPLQFLGEARTWLVQVDGALLAEQARTSLGKLAYQIQNMKASRSEAEDVEHRSPDFVSWWTGEVRLHVFGGETVTGYDDVTDLGSIRQNLDQNAMVLDQLEEDWVTHWARA